MPRTSVLLDHCEVIIDDGKKRRSSVRCNYCGKVLKRLDYLKTHLAGQNGKKSPCPKAPRSVWKMFQNYKPLIKGTTKEALISTTSGTTSKCRRKSTINDAAVAMVHKGQQKPYKDCFEEVEELVSSIRKIKESWPSTGCSILIDGWKDPTEGHNLVCFIVDCPKGPIYFCSSYLHVSSSRSNGDVGDALNMLNQVMESVGEDNVVQVIATSATGWIEALGVEFMGGKCKKQLLWTSSASHCLNLMLEKIERLDRVKAVLEKVKALLESQGHLKSSSSNNIMSALESLENVVQQKHKLETQVEDVSFWIEATLILRATLPLCRVLALISDDKMQIGYIYDAVDRAKEEIRKELEESDNYTPFWKIIDDVWTKYLHNPLHAAGYYLNPGLFYSDEFECDKEITNGLFHCMVCLIRDRDTLHETSQQLEKYRVGSGGFNEGSSPGHRDIPPLEWWTKYGGECPELQKVAIRVLSQTCDGAARYGLRQHIAARMSSKQSPELHEDFVHFNIKLGRARS